MHEGDLGIALGETGSDELEISKVLATPSMIVGAVSIKLEDDSIPLLKSSRQLSFATSVKCQIELTVTSRAWSTSLQTIT